MRVAVPHTLGKEEVRRRFAERSHEFASAFPGGMAQVESRWPSEDRLLLDVTAMGQTVAAQIDIEDSAVVLDVSLPPALSFIEPMVRSAVEAKGRKLLT